MKSFERKFKWVLIAVYVTYTTFCIAVEAIQLANHCEIMDEDNKAIIQNPDTKDKTV